MKKIADRLELNNKELDEVLAISEKRIKYLEQKLEESIKDSINIRKKILRAKH